MIRLLTSNRRVQPSTSSESIQWDGTKGVAAATPFASFLQRATLVQRGASLPSWPEMRQIQQSAPRRYSVLVLQSTLLAQEDSLAPGFTATIS